MFCCLHTLFYLNYHALCCICHTAAEWKSRFKYARFISYYAAYFTIIVSYDLHYQYNALFLIKKQYYGNCRWTDQILLLCFLRTTYETAAILFPEPLNSSIATGNKCLLPCYCYFSIGAGRCVWAPRCSRPASASRVSETVALSSAGEGRAKVKDYLSSPSLRNLIAA